MNKPVTPQRPFIMNLIKAVPAKQNGQDGYLMTYDVPDMDVPVLDAHGQPTRDAQGEFITKKAPATHIENPQWIPAANMQMLQEVSPDDAKEVIAAALAAGAKG